MAWKRFPGTGRSKYGNKKVWFDNQQFDSQREADRWHELRILQKAGKIQNLRRQVGYTLVPAQKARIRMGKAWETVTERAVKYVADFVYDEDGQTVVEDAKGFPTPEYKIKRKLMLERYGIAIREV